VKMDVKGEVSIWGTHLFETHGTYSFEFLDGGGRFPLAVGKEFTVEETAYVEGTQYEQPLNTKTKYVYRVEAIEDIRVDAGTFRCFRIVKYDELGETKIGTGWISDEVKQWPVKTDFDGSSGDLWATTELVDFSPAA
jgi:hypothetical protein